MLPALLRRGRSAGAAALAAGLGLLARVRADHELGVDLRAIAPVAHGLEAGDRDGLRRGLDLLQEGLQLVDLDVVDAERDRRGDEAVAGDRRVRRGALDRDAGLLG